jgi:prevent-host-death family protein
MTDDGPSALLGGRFFTAMREAASVHAIGASGADAHLAHLLRVTGLVLEDGGAEDEMIAALLHHADGDQTDEAARQRDIRTRYGDDVAEIVSVCTDSFNDPNPSWRARKIEHVRRIEDASPGGVRVSLADSLDHARGLVSRRRDGVGRAGGPAVDAGMYYASLARAFSRRLPGPRTAELGRLARELEQVGPTRTERTRNSGNPGAAGEVDLRAQAMFTDPGDPTRREAATPMTSIGIRELAANVSAVVADVANSGCPAVVTKHGEPVAVLIPIADLEALLLARALRDSEAVPVAAGRAGRVAADDASRTPAFS